MDQVMFKGKKLLEAHPKAIAASMDTRDRNNAKEREKQVVLDCMKRFNMRFLHVRSRNLSWDGVGLVDDEINQNGGITVAYAPANHRGGKKHNVYAVSTAICNPGDGYCRHTGRYRAATNYAAANLIYVRIPDGLNAAMVLTEMFALSTMNVPGG